MQQSQGEHPPRLQSVSYFKNNQDHKIKESVEHHLLCTIQQIKV